MADLVDFLLARIAEDEAAPGVLAEHAARRRIVERLARAADVAWAGSYAVRDDAVDNLRDLALPYADHPDYQPEWKP